MNKTTLNSAFEEELYFQFLRDPDSVSQQWRDFFNKTNGKNIAAFSQSGIEIQPGQLQSNATAFGNANSKSQGVAMSEVKLKPYEKLNQMASITTKIAENMEESLSVPTATSIRTIPVKALDENRRIVNKYLIKQKRNKVSFSQIMLWAIVKALQKFPRMNDAYENIDGKSYRVHKDEVNIGVAIDVTRRDGVRLLMVPSIKNATKMHFLQFIEAYEDLVRRGKNNKLTLDDLDGATVTLTNPGMIGTSASVPRLMKGMGMIVATGSIDYPPEFQAVRSEVINTLALSKVCTITNTYDHRIIQGAESAEFLAYLQKLLVGEYRFYDQIFASLKIPFPTINWEPDQTVRKYGYSTSVAKVEKAVMVMQLINAYRVRGHLLADVNPLGLQTYYYPELDPGYYGLNIWDLDREFPVDEVWEKESLTLRDILELLRDTYCGQYGIEYMHIRNTEVKKWISQRLEVGKLDYKLTVEDKKRIFNKLISAEQFENFLHTKFIGHKRFSLEGSETTVVMLDEVINTAADANLDSVCIGMAHRGRLNVLVNNIGKKYSTVFDEFDGIIESSFNKEAGDVKYHLGADTVFYNKNNKSIKLKLAPNPSHLELVNPVIEGMVRGIDDLIGDKSYSAALPVLIHGDAAFAGQGVVQEVFNFSQLDGYKTGGTIHIIINNQIGFTTSAYASRSTLYSSDVAKMLEIPVVHVNGNDPEAVAAVAKFAVEYREKFKTDIVIDLLGYRKYGHNEGDEPGFTQPLLYKKIRSMTPIREIYQAQLIKSGVITEEQANQSVAEFINTLQQHFDARGKNNGKEELHSDHKIGQTFEDYPTSISQDLVINIGNSISQYPDGFNANPKVKGGLKRRKEMIESKEPIIDWAMGEALAFGSLLTEGYPVRLSGEDSRRGTFSHRHAVLIDIESENIYIPMNHIAENQAKLQVFDSPLSELGVLGFDYGYSTVAKDTLTLWEAQFGDFANMAQPIIDQFIACGEIKWNLTSNIVLLLPHGQEGQGPEHSSARLERFLQLCSDENMIIGNFTTPAQYFHALRRQMKMQSHIPLIIMTPKSTLRHPLAVSGVEDMTNGKFQHIIDDVDNSNPNEITKLIFCTGKVYYDLLQAKRQAGKNNIAIARIEQLYPLNKDMLKGIIEKYPNANQIVWAQEEHKNQGAWTYMALELMEILPTGKKLEYVGRGPSASSATGSGKVHQRMQEELLNQALS